MAKVLSDPFSLHNSTSYLGQQAQQAALKPQTAPAEERWMEGDFPPYDDVKEDTDMTAADYYRYKSRLVNTTVIEQRQSQAELEAAGFKSWKEFLFYTTLAEF